MKQRQVEISAQNPSPILFAYRIFTQKRLCEKIQIQVSPDIRGTQAVYIRDDQILAHNSGLLCKFLALPPSQRLGSRQVLLRRAAAKCRTRAGAGAGAGVFFFKWQHRRMGQREGEVAATLPQLTARSHHTGRSTVKPALILVKKKAQ